MVSFINSWAQGIILAIIIATIIEIVLPDGKNKKYIKTIIGIYVLFSIIYPIITKISNKQINLNSVVDAANTKMSSYQNNDIQAIDTNAYIEETYKGRIEEELENKINEKGFNVDSLNLYIETEDESRYGTINSIVLQLSKNNKMNTQTVNNYINCVNEVEEINIDLSNSSNSIVEENKPNVSTDEISELKDYLSTMYSIEKEKIYINE